MSLTRPLLCRPISSSQGPPRHFHRPIPYSSPPLNRRLLHSSPLKIPRSFPNLSPVLGLPFRRNLGLGFIARSSADEGQPSDAGGVGGSNDEEEEARGQSTMPSRFRYLTKEAPDRPVLWPWLIVLFFVVYAWRTVLWELTNWKKTALAIAGFVGYLLKLAVAIIFMFIGDAVTAVIRYIETFAYSIHSMYTSIVGYAPVQELTVIILLTSTVLATAEAVVPTAVKSQPYLLTLAGLIGYGVIDGSVPELLFWLLLSGLFCFSRFIKKRDNVSATLPVAATAAAVGEPWVRVLAIVLYLALAIVQHSKSMEGKVEMETDKKERNDRKLPLPLLVAAFSIGIHIAAKWIRYRHLTWKAL
ncbi:hypothetical protein CKAN_01997600 [Cinnamomum micranthum f. kanehirae]|uniref:Embryo defective 1923 n=1 Tax=Cinnamomum micranthum f. kanehirae TaxID=337451 RepID=A0A3S3MVU5_9MAGN|nr:hypothetical protein CKAN_01997600 [Cinnamomum micranthum f. kanehirae]